MVKQQQPQINYVFRKYSPDLYLEFVLVLT